MKIIAILKQHTQENFKQLPFEELETALQKLGYEVLYPRDAQDLLKLVRYNPRVCGVVFDWDKNEHFEWCESINAINENLPIYAFVNELSVLDLKLDDLHLNMYFFEAKLHAGQEVAYKIDQATNAYFESVLPPFTKALFKYVSDAKYTFCTPGHMGGTAFQQSPAGSVFYDFYGPNMFRADISVSVSELGSLLSHTGPHKQAEQYIAQTFGADRSYIVTNGTSTANKIVGMFAAPSGSTILVDRNCHKSIAHMMMMSNVTPIYFRPTRNAYGIIGGIPKSEFMPKTIAEKVAKTPGVSDPVYAVITNSTYDGLLYNTRFIKETLQCPYIHFDSAWVPYTNFNPIYQGKFGMSGAPTPGKVCFETQSTHKLLAALSQTSMIHIQGQFNGREASFNESFMMHTSTSPQYGLVASAEMAAAMMNGKNGKMLMTRAIKRAMSFRQEMQKLRQESKDWFFDIWQPEQVSEAECWPLKAQDDWHGFAQVDEDHLYLDPIKVTVITPGMRSDGSLDNWGIPASLVAKFLDDNGIVVEKTGPYTMLFLFSIGIDKASALQLMRELVEFKHAYDQDLPIRQVLPSLYQEDPKFYSKHTLQSLARGIHGLIQRYQLPTLLDKAFQHLPEMRMTPHEAWHQELRGHVKTIPLSQMQGEISANMILPYPPGVPLIMPGEVITQETKPILDFLEVLCAIGEAYPGFETDIHGIEEEDGVPCVKVINTDE